MRHHSGKTLARGATGALIVTSLFGCDSLLAPAERNADVASCRTTPTGECVTFTPQATRLRFADMSEYERYLGTLVDQPTSTLESAEAQKGIESLRAYLDGGEETEAGAAAGAGSDGPTGNEAAALENDGVVRSDFPVGDAVLSTLNARGEVHIGASIFKVTRDNIYEVSPTNLSVLNEKVPTLSSPAPTDGDSRITIRAVETTLPRESNQPLASLAADPEAPSYHHLPGVGPHCYVYAGSNRMHGQSYITNLFFYTEAGVSTEWQRRKKFLWWSYWANTWQSGTLSHTWDGQLYFGSYTVPLAYVGPGVGSQSGVSTSRIHRTLRWGVGFGVRIRGNIHTHHSFSNGSGNGTCQTATSA
jgi:hypothetical protein